MEAEVSKIAVSPLTGVISHPRSEECAPLSTSVHAGTITYSLVLCLLLGLLVFSTAICHSIGAVHISIGSMLRALLHRKPLSATQHAILLTIRHHTFIEFGGAGREIAAVHIHARAFAELGAVGAWFFPEETLLSSRPPHVTDFLNDAFTLDYTRPRLMKTLRISMQESFAPELL